MKLIVLILSIFAIFPVNGQQTMRREIIRGDGSCLFSSLQYVLTTGVLEDGVNAAMRERIAKEIDNNPSLYNEDILDDPIETYKQNILKPETWGGGIELEIFSNYYEMEIGVCYAGEGNIIMIGAGNDHRTRVFVVYSRSKNHYDAMYKTNSPSRGQIQTVFRPDDDSSYAAALALCQQL